ncbi:hypothetical protein B0H10DRAFT_2070930 [Mycena sp. CBHHK59/15]|nr:hypothetical protein B0H10DRAFT_2070930 [Mycena sp. CBHHK59/15]
MGYLRRSPRISPTSRDCRSQARQSREESTERLMPRKRRSPTLSHGGQRKRSRTEIPIEWSALLIRRKAAQLLIKRYDTEGTTHESRPPSQARRRSPLVPHFQESCLSHSSSKPAKTEKPEPNPCSNIWRTVCEIWLRNFFTQTPLGVLSESTRVPTGPVWGLDQILSPTIAESVPKGTSSDPSRNSQWADGWGPQPSVAASVTALILRKRFLNKLHTYENVLHLFQQFEDQSALWSAVCTKFEASLLAAYLAVEAHDLAGLYTVTWSESELVKFPVLVLAYGDNFKRIAIHLPNKTTTQAMAHFHNHCKELEKIDIVQHIVGHLSIL